MTTTTIGSFDSVSQPVSQQPSRSITTTVTAVRRIFKTGSTTFPDPGPAYSPDQVKEFYQSTHGFLINFEVDGPTFIDGVEHYDFVKEAGTKG